MPEIEPFRGILYDPSKVEVAQVLAPPYDVIDEAGKKALLERDPHNAVRLILPDGDGEAKYAEAGRTLQSWLADGTLARDARPAIYRYHQLFQLAELGDRSLVRRGFIAAVRLHQFDEGVILPHERTLSGPKVDRLHLMRATGCHFSQIFTMYSDPSRRTDQLFRKSEDRAPDLEGVTPEDGTLHRLWRVCDREIIGQLQKLMAPLSLYIADGHHRYETMLALRDELRQAAGGELGFKSAAQYGTMFVANMDDAGLFVLPTHRSIHGVEGFDADAMFERCRAYFEITPLVAAADDPELLRVTLAERSEVAPTFAALLPGDADAYIMSRRGAADLAGAGITGSRALLDLDVTLLHELVLDRILGISREAQAAKTNISYIKDTAQAMARNAAGDGQITFVMNPPPLSQVRAIADAHDFMPQKSTFFYPKIASGLVMNRVDPKEDL
ncbi:MAG TPA: DUF1015 domain-containing protein [Kofleriaceae bacterium]|nr:DUF1015 domain-containing protein [Kofleriaceae bacterium]